MENFISEQSLLYNTGLALFNKLLLDKTISKDTWLEVSESYEALKEICNIKCTFHKIDIITPDPINVIFTIEISENIYILDFKYNRFQFVRDSINIDCHITEFLYYFPNEQWNNPSWEFSHKYIINIEEKARQLCKEGWKQFLPYNNTFLKDKIDLSNNDCILLCEFHKIYYLFDWGYSLEAYKADMLDALNNDLIKTKTLDNITLLKDFSNTLDLETINHSKLNYLKNLINLL